MEACFQGDTQSRGRNIHICWSLVGPPGGKKKLLEQHLGERYILWKTLCLVFLIETIRGASYSLLIFFSQHVFILRHQQSESEVLVELDWAQPDY